MEVQNLWQTMEKGKMDKQMKIAVVGVGLIGGSFALTLKEKGLAAEVVGVDNSEPNRNKALELGLVDRFEELPAAVAGADLIVLATESIKKKLDVKNNWYIIWIRGVYDVPQRAKDGEELEDSEDVYDYIMCCICPMKLTPAPGPLCGDAPDVGYRVQRSRGGRARGFCRSHGRDLRPRGERSRCIGIGRTHLCRDWDAG